MHKHWLQQWGCGFVCNMAATSAALAVYHLAELLLHWTWPSVDQHSCWWKDQAGKTADCEEYKMTKQSSNQKYFTLFSHSTFSTSGKLTWTTEKKVYIKEKKNPIHCGIRSISYFGKMRLEDSNSESNYYVTFLWGPKVQCLLKNVHVKQY